MRDELNEKNEQQATETIELTLSQFQEQYGFDPSDMFTNEIELTTENKTSPSTNFDSDAPSSSNVILTTLNHIPDMPDNKEFLDVNLADAQATSLASSLVLTATLNDIAMNVQS
ncbi:hypothetical protein DPMN_145270 [Dreissena polymorpha]|uniref:Uncharacterized protein n=1 Tax=Dreissena polymorpha TaxID=45954 RepID=A0A9D4IYN1_DREPO|nr:hypothetical protein DPMN_145270 [Dreissena polymorpha]